MLSVSGIHTYYGRIHALKGVSLTVQKGEIVSLIGANGAGKTTTLQSIVRLLPLHEGRVVFDGADLTAVPAERVVGMGMAMVPEGRKIFPRLSVLENLEMGAYSRNDAAGIAEDLEKVFSMFPRLRERAKQLGGTLSGGEQQMLAIGRALMSRPRLLLMDEPSLGLAPIIVDQIFETIVAINRTGVSLLLVEQNAHVALSIAHRGYVMETGTIVLEDKASALLTNEQVRKAYLGE